MTIAEGFVRSGKVRDLDRVDADRLLLVASDRLSAFDVVLPTPIPDKGRVLLALVEEGGLSREDAYAIVQRDALAAADTRRPFRELLAADPAVSDTLPSASLEACFDDAHLLRNVPAVVARLDALQPVKEAVG